MLITSCLRNVMIVCISKAKSFSVRLGLEPSNHLEVAENIACVFSYVTVQQARYVKINL